MGADSGPWWVDQVVNKSELAGWYEHRYHTAPYEDRTLLDRRDEVRNGPSERTMYRCATREEAQRRVEELTAGDPRPGVTYSFAFVDI